MEKVIYKYELEIQDSQRISMPMDAQILCVKTQHGTPHIWVLCDPELQKRDFTIEIHGTGAEIDSRIITNSKYVGTFLVRNDSLVFHVFERLDK